MKKVIIIIIIIIVAWFVIRFIINSSEKEEPVACTMDAKLCPDGSYVSRIPPECNFAPCPKEDLIQVESPGANEIISSPIIVRGKARGFWFFEADFPVELLDEQGNIIGTAIAQAQGEWMTEDFVAFEVQIEFDVSEETNATLILKKDNPSGLPEYDDELQIPIRLIP